MYNTSGGTPISVLALEAKMTQSQLKSYLHYNPNTGIFTRINNYHTRFIGKTAGSLNSLGYIKISINNKSYAAHRLALLYEFGELPTNEVDHIDHNRSNNKITNLRIVSRTINNRNKTFQKNNTSGTMGVRWHKSSKRWRAEIKVQGKKIHLGAFKIIEDAKKCRKEGIAKYGFHKNHGQGGLFNHERKPNAIQKSKTNVQA